MYGDLANKLILDAKRSTNLSELPLYQADLVKDIIKEAVDLNKDAEFLSEEQRIHETDSQDSSEEKMKINQCQLFVTHLCMRRNKRCLLAYQKMRSDKIDEFSWMNIDPITESGNNDTNKNGGSSRGNASNPLMGNSTFANYTTQLNLDNLNHAEQEYYKNYQHLLINYKSNFADIDLSGDLEPPSNIFTDVRVLKSGGEVQTEYGVFNLIKDSQFYVRKSDVERLIQQGYLEEL